MLQKFSLGVALMASAASAAIISGKETAATTVLYNLTATYPKAKKTDGTTASDNPLKWTITNRSYKDEDTGKMFLEITNSLTAPILSTDQITFHLEFRKSTDNTEGLYRDGFECTVKKQITTSFWDTTATDIFVRGADKAAAVAANDFNNAVALDGKDWFVYEKDSERDEKDLLCKTDDTSTTAGYQCSEIRCIIRREMTTDDADDFSFAPTASTDDSMTIPASFSYILMNQSEITTVANKQKLQNFEDSTLVIGMGAVAGTVVSTAACLASILSLTAF